MLRYQDVVDGWTLSIGIIVILLAMPGVCQALENRKLSKEAGPAEVSMDGTSVPLEWLGVDTPFTDEDVLVLDQKLDLPEVSSVSA